jgi:hypothetical protein
VPTVRARGTQITDDDRAYWAYQPLRAVAAPAIDDAWCRNPIDAFVLARLQEAGLRPAPAADKRTLIRRVYFDLWGVPPAPDDVAAFLADERPDAFARLVDRLLDHPNYGRRWARHWLDLVRYAESDGYKQDGYRPHAWRYRDYVIDAFNSDKPYDRFVTEQLAGDEVAPHDPQALAATAYLRHTIYEYNQRDVRTQWDLMVNELVDVTADVFLGVGLSCARCHDHKFDPILQRDYFRFRAFFEPILPRDDLPYATPEQIAAYDRQYQVWLEKTRDVRAEIDAIAQPFRDRVINPAIDKFPKDVRPLLRKSSSERLPQEIQIAELARRQLDLELEKLDIAGKLKDDADKRHWEDLQQRLAALDADKPAPLPPAFSVTDVGGEAPPTIIPGDTSLTAVEPGYLTVIDGAAAQIEPPPDNSQTTGRRTALARWITDSRNPLTTRVIVNRVWQYHFDQGLVPSSSDFGRLGETPSHPELLDWLATHFVESGWSFKSLHRLILNSAAWQQATTGTDPARAMVSDPGNRLLWHMPLRRLDAEQIRDAMLLVSGELIDRGAGPSDDADRPVRSIYTKVVRNSRADWLDAFDAPDAFGSTARRNVTTTPTQALLLINSPETLHRASALAARLQTEAGGAAPAALVDRGYRLVLGRACSPEEMAEALHFIAQQQQRIVDEKGSAVAAGTTQTADHDEPEQAAAQALIDFCHVLLNSSEFLYVP